jgi:TRAP-type mannitol/chloroaromatic compound transport system permease large subunit
LGTILAGIATPAEAAAVGAFGALVLSYFYKTLKWKNFKESVFLTAKTTAMIMWLFIGSWTFASVFSYLGGHEVFEHFFKSLNLQPWQFLVITQIIIFFTRLAFRVDRNTDYFCTNIFTFSRIFWSKSLFLCNVDCIKFTNIIFNTTHGHVSLLFKRCSV